MIKFAAVQNVPGYSPMADELTVFDSAREAWEYLTEERKRSEDDGAIFDGDADSVPYSRTVTLMASLDEVGVVYGATPGYDGDHDLGLAYSVVEVAESELYPEGIKARLEYLRGEIQAERISYDELAELQSLAEHIEKGDVELLEWAGVPEFDEE